MCPTSHSLPCPNVSKTEYNVVDLDEDGFLTLMSDNGDTRSDVQLPSADFYKPELRPRILKLWEDSQEGGFDLIVTVQKAMGQECVIDTKTVDHK